MKPRSIGVFGGTFDPFHLAHLRMARAFIAEADLGELRLTPAGDPYHRDQECSAAAHHRLAMVKLGIVDQTVMVVDDREIRRPGESYTVDTLREVRAEIGTECPLWFLIGTDSLARLDTWKNWRQLFCLAHLAVAIRPGFCASQLPSVVRTEWARRQGSGVPIRAASGTILRLTLPPLDLSASAIRDGLAKDIDISHLVPSAIASYIREHGLYR